MTLVLAADDRASRACILLDDVSEFVTEQMLAVGFHAGSRRDEWRRRVHTAYVALFRPVLPGHGDPYPPDVPPPVNPGVWPDIPSSSIPGSPGRL